MKRTRPFVTAEERLSKLKAKKAQGRGGGRWWQPIGNLAQICTVGVVLFGNFYRAQPTHGDEEASVVALQAAIANLQRERALVAADIRELSERLVVTENALASERVRFHQIAEELRAERVQVARGQGTLANVAQRAEPAPVSRNPKEGEREFKCFEDPYMFTSSARMWDAGLMDLVTVEEWCMRQRLIHDYFAGNTERSS